MLRPYAPTPHPLPPLPWPGGREEGGENPSRALLRNQGDQGISKPQKLAQFI
jgi:hypothetical protein